MEHRGPRALILGGGDQVMSEAQHALKMFEPDAVFVINDMIAKWPGPIDYICTLHPDKLLNWTKMRHNAGFSDGYQIWSHKAHNASIVKVDRVTNDWSGSSGLFAVRVALQERFSKIVLAGVPMQPDYKHIVRAKNWHAATYFQRAWVKRKQEIKKNVRSMSGFTKNLLGEPTREWLDS